MIIAEATTKSGKLVQVEEKKSAYGSNHMLFVDGERVSLGESDNAASAFFQACMEGCEDE